MILVAGPCVIEDYVTLEQTLNGILNIIEDKDIEFYFKSSALKDNRTKTENYRSVQTFFAGLRFLRDMARSYNVKICTDFHTVEQVKEYSQYVDMVQIPAFLSRQVSLLEAVGDYAKNKVVLIKKMQSASPKDIQIPVNIIKNKDPDKRIIVVDRGTAFGYDELMFDPRHIPVMKSMSLSEVLVDITHMNKGHGRWYWESYDFAGVLARSSMAAGADGLFMETHVCPSEAMCDAKTQLTLEQFEKITKDIVY